MLRRKEVIVVPEGELKEKLLALIAEDQKAPTVLTARKLWRYLRKEICSKELIHYRYHNRTELLEICEGSSKDFWMKYTWNV